MTTMEASQPTATAKHTQSTTTTEEPQSSTMPEKTQPTTTITKRRLDYTETKSFKSIQVKDMDLKDSTLMDEAEVDLDRFNDSIMAVGALFEERIKRITDAVSKSDGGGPSAAEGEAAKTVGEEGKKLLLKIKNWESDLDKIEGGWNYEWNEGYGWGP
ncbi:MAG: hypothetical protein Q9221_003623 [Calogaya cf. arnoldii]